ncbi:hypothetical protein ACOMHN_055278 [Nucella lapillus]
MDQRSVVWDGPEKCCVGWTREVLCGMDQRSVVWDGPEKCCVGWTYHTPQREHSTILAENPESKRGFGVLPSLFSGTVLKRLKQVARNVALNQKEKYHGEFQFVWMGEPEMAEAMTSSALTAPTLFVLQPATRQFYVPPFHPHNVSLLNFEHYLDGVRNGSVPAQGGTGFLQRLKRIGNDIWYYLTSTWKTSPWTVVLIIAVPCGILSAVVWGMCGRDSVDVAYLQALKAMERQAAEEAAQDSAQQEGKQNTEKSDDKTAETGGDKKEGEKEKKKKEEGEEEEEEEEEEGEKKKEEGEGEKKKKEEGEGEKKKKEEGEGEKEKKCCTKPKGKEEKKND